MRIRISTLILAACFLCPAVFAEPLPYDRHNAVVDVVKKVSPSVVAIKSDVHQAVAPNPVREFWQGFRGFTDPFVRERVYSSAGSGIIVDSKGVLVTNAHVISDAHRLTGTTADGRTHDLILLGVDKDFDLAVLQISPSTAPEQPQFVEIDWGTSDDLMIGETIVVIGSALAFQNSVSTGIVSAVERSIKVRTRDKPYFGMIQTDAAINRGNSGGPLVNIRGELIGVTTLIASEGGGSDGIGFAIPVERVAQVYREFVFGIVSLEEQLGIEYVTPKAIDENIDAGQAQRLGLTDNRVEGLIAVELAPDGLAYQAGLRRGDLLIEIDGREVPNLLGYQRALEGHDWDQRLKLDFLRYLPEKKTVDRLQIEIDSKDIQSRSIDAADSWFGINVRGIDNDFAERLNVSIDEGVVVSHLDRNAPAARSGIQAGDMIVSINKYPVQTIGDFRRLRYTLQDQRNIGLRIRRGNQMGDVVIAQ